jgi:uncharacterized membrane protein
MDIVNKLTGKFRVVGGLVKFFWERKLWWLIPMLLVLLVMGLLVVFVQSSTVVPFVYVLF